MEIFLFLGGVLVTAQFLSAILWIGETLSYKTDAFHRVLYGKPHFWIWDRWAHRSPLHPPLK